MSRGTRVRGRKPKHARRRVDLTSLKDALRDGRVHTCLGLVTDEDAPSHYELDGEDLLVEVSLIPDETRVTARMGALGGGAGLGVWLIPPVGSEVAVLVPDGELEFGPVIVGVLSTGSLPNGVAPDTIVIAQGKVLIHDGSGGTEPVILKSQYDAHTHPSGTGPTGTSEQRTDERLGCSGGKVDDDDLEQAHD